MISGLVGAILLLVFFIALDHFTSWAAAKRWRNELPYNERDYYECLDLIYDGKPPLDEIDKKRHDELIWTVTLSDPPKVEPPTVIVTWIGTGGGPLKTVPPVEKGLFVEFDVKNRMALCMDCKQWISFDHLRAHVHRLDTYPDR